MGFPGAHQHQSVQHPMRDCRSLIDADCVGVYDMKGLIVKELEAPKKV